jgi:hypothetical protein
MLDGSSYSNTLSGNVTNYNNYGMYIDNSSDYAVVWSHTASHNTESGVYITDTAGNAVLRNVTAQYNGAIGLNTNDSHAVEVIGGTFTNNDIGMYDTSSRVILNATFSDNVTTDYQSTNYAHLYNSSMAKNVSTTASIISHRADGTAGVSRIWGAYATAADTTETPQTESTEKYNYSNNSWEKSATENLYYGSGTLDTNLDYDLSSATLSSGPYVYHVEATTNNQVCASTTFAVYRNGTNVGTATCGSLFTDTNGSVNVKFKIDGGGASKYLVGDAYNFVVWDASGDTNTKKSVQMMSAGASYTVTSGTTAQFLGQSATANPTEITRGYPSGSWHMDVAGTINAQYYEMSYLGGTGGANGLDLQSGATVTNLADGLFTNYQDTGGASDTYIKVHGSLIGSGSPSKTFANLIFYRNSSSPDYTVTETGGAPSNGNYWLLDTATCTGWTTCEASDSDAGDGAGSPNQDGFIRFVIANPGTATPGVRVKDGTVRVKDGTVRVAP